MTDSEQEVDLEPYPWEEEGWLAETTVRLSSILKNLGYSVTGKFEQEQSSLKSFVLFIDTDRGTVMFKATHSSEIATVECVSSFAPYLVPKPLFTDIDEGWMLIKDYGDSLEDKLHKDDFDKILQLHGNLQFSSLKFIQRLEEAGLIIQDADTLTSRSLKMLGDPDVSSGLQELANEDDEVSSFGNSVSEFLKKLYVELKLPIALVHGDVEDSKLMKEEDGVDGSYVLMGWENARIDIPFSDVGVLESQIVPVDHEDDDNGEHGIDLYLELWHEFGTVEQLRGICCCVLMKDMLLLRLSEYEQSKELGLQTYLEDRSLNHLLKTLRDIHSSLSFLSSLGDG